MSFTGLLGSLARDIRDGPWWGYGGSRHKIEAYKRNSGAQNECSDTETCLARGSPGRAAAPWADLDSAQSASSLRFFTS
jgi:hypothetical protein